MDNHWANSDWPNNNGIAFFIAYKNRPKLVIIPQLEFRQPSVGENFREFGWSIAFLVRNDGNDSAKLTRFEVSAEREPHQRWQAPSKDEQLTHPLIPSIPYKGSRKLEWFSQGLQVRYTGDDYEYYTHGEKTSTWMFKKGDIGVVLPVNSIKGGVYAEGRVKKEFSAMLCVTGNPDEPFRLVSLHGLTDPSPH